VDEARNHGGVRIGCVTFFVNCLFYVVVEAFFDEFLVEDAETVQKVQKVNEITMQFVLMDGVDLLEHVLDCVFLDGFIDFCLALGVGE
jgi:hypothetical protein